jgi:hypothetical protein
MYHPRHTVYSVGQKSMHLNNSKNGLFFKVKKHAMVKARLLLKKIFFISFTDFREVLFER